MDKHLSRVPLSRREFLKNLAAGGGSALVATGAPAFLPLATLSFGALRVGLLLPSFRSYPQVGASFLNGFRLFQTESGSGNALQLLTGDAQSPSGLTAQALAKMCEQARPDVVVSLANPSVAQDLHRYLEERNIPLLISHAGANRIDRVQSNIFYNTLGYWQASFRAGAWAVETLGKRAVVVSSFYESGYDALRAFEEGLEEAGGQVVARHVTHVPGRPLTMATLMRRIATQDADFVYAHYSGDEGAAFVGAYTASRYTRQTPLLGSSFLLESALPGPAKGAVRNIYSISSWTDSLRDEKNALFLNAFRSRYGRTADSFAVLGFETAGLLSAAGVTSAGSVAEGLRRAQFSGPRGVLALEGVTGSVVPPLYLRQIRWTSNGYRTSVRDTLPSVPERSAPTGNVRTGWLNPYLNV